MWKTEGIAWLLCFSLQLLHWRMKKMSFFMFFTPSSNHNIIRHISTHSACVALHITCTTYCTKTQSRLVSNCRGRRCGRPECDGKLNHKSVLFKGPWQDLLLDKSISWCTESSYVTTPLNQNLAVIVFLFQTQAFFFVSLRQHRNHTVHNNKMSMLEKKKKIKREKTQS